MQDNTIYYFKEISKIPRESGNEKEISEYIEKFAINHHLSYQKDSFHNIIIYKYVGNTSPIILQAHLDMVCEKEKNLSFDFSKDKIEVLEKDGYLTSNGTTLGADNGIGVAQILNILEKDLKISIEAIFTTSEETTMEGAEKIDLSKIKGSKMINLDGFLPDAILRETASFTDLDYSYSFTYPIQASSYYQFSLSGLEGGHSGFDIQKNRGNSIQLLAEFLSQLDNVLISDFQGGSKINVIPSSSFAIVLCNDHFKRKLDEFLKEKRKMYPNLTITYQEVKRKSSFLTRKDSTFLLQFLTSFPDGVYHKNRGGEVLTSINLAVLSLRKNILRVGLRSSISKDRDKVLSLLKKIGKGIFQLQVSGYQPGFSTKEDSSLIQELSFAYKRLNGVFPKTCSIHIGVEAGILKEKLKELDVAIISPNIIGAHSPEEKVEIASIKRTNEWLFEYFHFLTKDIK